VVVRLYERDDLDARLTELGIPVVAMGLHGGRAGQTWPWAALKLRRVLRRWRPDVVHTSLFNGNLVGQLAGASLRIPVVSTFNRTGEADLQRQLKAVAAGWKGRVMQAVGRWSARRGDVHYRAVGDYARTTNCASMGLDLDRSTAVPRGVQISPADVAGADRSAFGLPAEGPLFVNVARRVPEKAQHLLVEAFGKVRSELPDAQLAIAGASGPADGAVTAAIADAGLAGAVHLLGFRSDVRALVALADVFAFSSISEGSPGAVVEALVLGAPLAAFEIPPVVELTDGGRHAWLAPIGSVDGLAQAMLSAYRADDREERVQAAQRWAERYRLPAVAEQLGDLLERRAGRTVAREAAEVVR
jgi:glycosyltransferase involved in cell wall biosynthesis